MSSFDFDFRPTYFGPQSLEEFYKSRIKGTVRKQIVPLNFENSVPSPLTESSLTEELRTEWGQIHPEFMGGEYLPDLGEFELEIGSIILRSVTGDVFSIRVKKDQVGYSYRVVDEYSSTFELPEVVKKSEEPLSFGEMVILINECYMISEGGDVVGPGLVKPDLQFMFENGGSPESIKGFVRVESDFYPQLHEYFEYQEDIWYQELKDEWDED